MSDPTIHSKLHAAGLEMSEVAKKHNLTNADMTAVLFSMLVGTLTVMGLSTGDTKDLINKIISRLARLRGGN